MKKFSLLLLMIGLMGVGQGQPWVKGTVVDKSNSTALPFATVVLMTVDSTVVTGAVTDEMGDFHLKVPKRGEYVLTASFIGYNTVTIALKVEGEQTQLAPIALEPDAKMLEAVQVVDRAPIVEQKMDKLVMNVSKSVFAQGSSALDLLRKAPGVSIDREGNVLLNGQPVAVWIDGRPSHLDGKSLETLLQGTDGTNIDRIEVIANPSAKYDAEGQGGIVDIRTKHHFAQGLDGSLSVKAGGMGFGRELEYRPHRNQFFMEQGVNANVNFRTEKTNTFVQLAEQSQQIGVNLTNMAQYSLGGVALKQYSGSLVNVETKGLTLKLGNDWYIDSSNTVGAIFTMPFSSVRQWDDSSYSYQSVSDNVWQMIRSVPVTEYSLSQYIGNLNYTHIFDPSRSAEITANLDYFHNITNSNNQQDNHFLPCLPLMEPRLLPVDSTHYLNLYSDNTIDIYSAKADYQSLVFGSYMLEAGAKYALSHTDNNLTQIRGVGYSGNDSILGSTIHNPFDYTEHVGALYATVAHQFSPSWSAKAGLRGEYTYAYNTSHTVAQDYFDLFPTLFVGYNSADFSKRGGLTYSRRITRPNYNQLNPFQNYVDAHTSNMGNPDLKPSYSDNVSLTAGFGRYLTLMANFIYTKDQLTVIPTLDPSTGNQVMHYDNFGSTTLMGGGLAFTEFPIGKVLTFSLNAHAYDYRSYDAASTSRVAGQTSAPTVYDKHSLLASAYAVLTLNLPAQWKVQIDGYYSTPIIVGYLHTSSNELVNLGVKKSAFDGRLLFSLQVNDIFRTMSNSFDVLYADGVVSKFEQNYLMQKVTLGVQWKFGSAQKPLRQRNVGTLDELERATNTSGQIN